MNTGREPRQNDASLSDHPDQLPGRETTSIQPQAESEEGATSQRASLTDALRPTPGSNVARIYGISDCVIAVAFTLFVVNIRLPPTGLSASGLKTFVTHDMLRDVALYIGTYLVVASSWISHYRIFTHLRQSSDLFVMLNVVFLASIVFLPVAVALFYRYTNEAGVWQVFAGTQALASITLLLMWIVATVDHLLDSQTPAVYWRYVTARLLIIALGTLLSFAVAFVNVLVAEGIFLCLFILAGLWHILAYRSRHAPGGGGYLAGTIRMCSITDNMTAVALTFLIATIASVGVSASHQPFAQELTTIGSVLPLYGITFLIVGFYWLSHHRIFMLIRRHDMLLIWLNFSFLLFIELQPQFNALRSTYPSAPLTSSLYAANQALCGLMLLVIWIYAATRHRLIDRAMTRRQVISLAWRALVPPLLFLLSIASIFFQNNVAIALWPLVIGIELARVIVSRLRRRPHEVPQVHTQP